LIRAFFDESWLIGIRCSDGHRNRPADLAEDAAEHADLTRRGLGAVDERAQLLKQVAALGRLEESDGVEGLVKVVGEAVELSARCQLVR
jgi:hypothetical protein